MNHSLDDFGRIESTIYDGPTWDSRSEAERRQLYVAKLAERCDELLPAEAAGGGWPVQFDHCFRRLAYDWAVSGDWREEIDGETFIDDAPVAVVQMAACAAMRMVHDGPGYAWKLQEMSLLWRGELDPADCEHVDGRRVLGLD